MQGPFAKQLLVACRYRGVHWASRQMKFNAMVTIKKAVKRWESVSLGYWTSEVKAAKAWDQATICTRVNFLGLYVVDTVQQGPIFDCLPLQTSSFLHVKHCEFRAS